MTRTDGEEPFDDGTWHDDGRGVDLMSQPKVPPGQQKKRGEEPFDDGTLFDDQTGWVT